MAHEEQLYKLSSSGKQLDFELDINELQAILNKDIQGSLPSKNPTIASMLSDAGSQIHFNNHVKLAEYSRLHDKYWKVYTKLVDLIPKEKHQFGTQKVKDIFKIVVFSDIKLSKLYKKALLEFLSSYETLERKLFHWIRPNHDSLLELYESYSKSEYGIAISICDRYAIMGNNLINSIRNVYKSNIPIHVYYVGDPDLNPLNQNMIKSSGPNVELHDLSAITDHDFVRAESFATKVFAQLLTPARHVMLLDADVVLLQSPESIFSSSGYKNSGTLFFHDRQIFEPKPETISWFLSLLPDKISDTEPPKRLENNPWFTGKTQHIQESGMVIIDKVKHLTPLLTTALLNKKVERELTYKRVYGDKETFWIGFEVIGHSYYFAPYEPHPIGDNTYFPREESFEWDEPKQINDDSKPEVFCSCHMLHFDQNTNPLWINGGLWNRKDHIELGLADYNSYSWGPGQWELFDDGMWGCYKGEKGVTVTKPLGSEYQKVLTEITIQYSNFFNNVVINPLKNL
ncbi:glycosyltransferase family 71 protein [Conidiobolus coronatus NRRL 28638]|uniref:Glycosyltransferase family 71 protein n=1 Tax=Conidiobolus coronatus (strain ATCC 28846 / CBS 209.66 / NRRL 28638) TaxID=796925 RepID=A0A137PDN4_CONC2|nr:glycosyltransferase family 71 protein [Conidiobolus coronatus NRRL 28638]|eukprot:KXN73107.1 glycosyltransferase family 71 protein [Conidiobolus coronatus NRRL 28638]